MAKYHGIIMDYEGYNLTNDTAGEVSKTIFDTNYKKVNNTTVNENISLNYRHNFGE